MEEITPEAIICSSSCCDAVYPGSDLPVREKVLVITPFHNGVGGAETFSQSLIKELSKKYSVFIATLPPQKKAWRGLNFWKSFNMVIELIKRCYTYPGPFKIIYAQGFIATLVARIYRGKGEKIYTIILALYDFRERPIFSFFIRQLLKGVDKIFVEGYTGEGEMLYIGIKQNKIIRFVHWCDHSKFYYKARYNDIKVVLFVGRPIKEKGKHFVKTLEECNIKDRAKVRFEYVENLSYDLLPSYYQMADVCIVPSVYSEGHSRVVIEAASCGCFILTSEYGALPEMIWLYGLGDTTGLNTWSMFYKLKNRLFSKDLDTIQAEIAEHALIHFSERNAEVFYE